MKTRLRVYARYIKIKSDFAPNILPTSKKTRMSQKRLHLLKTHRVATTLGINLIS